MAMAQMIWMLIFVSIVPALLTDWFPQIFPADRETTRIFLSVLGMAVGAIVFLAIANFQKKWELGVFVINLFISILFIAIFATLNDGYRTTNEMLWSLIILILSFPAGLLVLKNRYKEPFQMSVRRAIIQALFSTPVLLVVFLFTKKFM